MTPFAFSSLPTLIPALKTAGRRVCAILGLAAIASLAACTTEQQAAVAPPPPVAPPPAPHQLSNEQPGFLRLPNTTPNQVPVRVGILLPFSNGSQATRKLATAMMNAAEMALYDAGNKSIILMAADEGGGPDEAAAAAQKLLDQGAEIILGPLFAQSVAAVGPVARDRGVPVIAFSTNRDTAGNGVYLLSFQPENEVKRVLSYAAANGHAKFAALVPQNAYGDHIAAAFNQDVPADSGAIADVERFSPDTGDVVAQAAGIAKTGPDALLVAQGGQLLRGIAPTLAYDGLDNQHVQLLGTGLWDDPAVLNEPALVGGWFAAPQPNADSAFDARYQADFGSTPPQLSTLAYDAVSLVALLANGAPYHRFTPAALTDPNGFAGVTGIFRFTADGACERGLAILGVGADGFTVVSPAPTTFQKPGS
ncbi:MAG: penicillin-binding protein activator [Alphaproteobacteria bacterium]|nr:penicillin-binding protein activator [Alphaproteobacteria bacterium]MDE2014598.1 penicillin-binding protein activator [Alphaproteobacteria bacterium]MDE2072855.1 penicillin-binding protein activator [Alphaproteobacteria bacterium]